MLQMYILKRIQMNVRHHYKYPIQMQCKIINIYRHVLFWMEIMGASPQTPFSSLRSRYNLVKHMKSIIFSCQVIHLHFHLRLPRPLTL